MRMSDWSSDVCSSDLRPANIMGEAPFDGERALLEIIVMVRRHAGRVARAFEPLDRVDHEGGAAVNAAEAAGRRRHFQRIDPDLRTACGGRPRRKEMGRASCRERVCQYV